MAQVKALTQAQAKRISELLNSLCVWQDSAASALRRKDHEEFDKAWRWAEEVRQEMRTLGIRFAGDVHTVGDITASLTLE